MNQKTALVTGANSGVGLETVKQLSQLGYTKIILVCRTIEKGEVTIKKLLDEGFNNVYSVLAANLADKKSSHNALKELIDKNYRINLLILNACIVPKTLERNDDGMELSFASALLGHHILTVGLLDADLLTTDARIVTAGSEAARGDMPMMGLPNIDKIINEEFNGDSEDTLRSFMFPSSNKKYHPMKNYSLTKLYVSLWTRSLARKLPNHIIANSISPGATPNTNFARHQSWVMQKIMLPIMKTFGPMMGMSGTLKDAAKRYLKILDFDETTNGKFWVSKKGKMIGPLVIFSSPYLENVNFQNAVWNVIENTSSNKA
ncbi:SDR family NAD(P)-dependent oxidoreductase [Flavivirga algicola]|uniref:SDR family NAD(P)-dependent oxidoreductase n=1 Tax=Flavivirga algicola TaxID=2729136 RepID=A0ABX1S3N3_9FLAO|nr:SDR family NAD(P)-dependent oxidoreductase [Flavivirga algicola]NMH89044.1 SDR family NAD(P)-dependent oxidoreductase [Flavivirga algicola]